MTLLLQINRQDKLALYRQIAEQIRTQIHVGRLPAGARLPTVRLLAEQLHVTRLTIQNAYAELQADDLIESFVGRGTYVSRSAQPSAISPLLGQQLTPGGVLSDMHKLMHVRNMRSMAVAVPDPSFLPADEFWQELVELRADAQQLLGYTPIVGDPDLRIALAALLNDIDIDANPDDILVADGAMQGLNLVARTFTRPGDVVLVEQPTFLGFISLLKVQGLRPVTVPVDSDGPDLEQLEQVMKRHRPRFYYTIPSFHNPTGYLFSMERRRAMLALAKRYDVLILEDDINRFLAYDGPAPPPLRSMDEHGQVIYLSSLSKMLIPGVRVGYLNAAPKLLKELGDMRHVSDLCGIGLIQRATASFLQNGGLKRHLKRTVPLYKQRRNAMLHALQTHMPNCVSWTIPRGGYCCWVTMPRLFPPGGLYRAALQKRVAIAAGDAFFTSTPDAEYFRLSFGNQTGEAIRAGVEQLAQLINEQLARQPMARDELKSLPIV